VWKTSGTPSVPQLGGDVEYISIAKPHIHQRHRYLFLTRERLGLLHSQGRTDHGCARLFEGDAQIECDNRMQEKELETEVRIAGGNRSHRL
jgi:hypothetical protein